MALFAGGLLPWVKPQFIDDDGQPVAGGFLYFYVAGTTTPQDTFSDVELTPGTENTNPIELDSGGFSATSIFLQPTGYQVKLEDANNVQLWIVDDVEDLGQTFASTWGNVLAEGGKNVTSGYSILTTDRLVTVSSTGGADPCLINLLPASEATQPLSIMNVGDLDVAVTPNGADTINLTATPFTLSAQSSSSQPYPVIQLVSDGVSAYYIVSAV